MSRLDLFVSKLGSCVCQRERESQRERIRENTVARVHVYVCV